MYHHMYGNWGSGLDWLWMTLMIVFWLAVLGGIVYVAVRLANQHDRKPPLGQ
jgi:hypothetical protein